MVYNQFVIDEIGRKHERKNQYILDQISSREDGVAAKSGKDHPYNQAMEKYQNEEKEKLQAFDEQYKANKIEPVNSKYNLEERLAKAEYMLPFYEHHTDLTYDAVLKARIHKHETNFIPDMIQNEIDLKESLAEKERELQAIKPEEVQAADEKIKQLEADLKEKTDSEIAGLKDSYQNKMISKKAFETEKKAKTRAYDKDKTALAYLNPKTSLEEEIKNIKHHQKMDTQTNLNVLDSEISDARRKTPIEVEKQRPIFAYLTFLIPGLGQLLNKQYAKAIFFFIGTLFIYLIAIPYALGYGNYQGEGIAGLINLAEGGAKLDRSILFMIEGIIAVMFLLISLFIMVASFKDVLKVEKNTIAGIRPKTWKETKKTVGTDGFPYLITTPALLVILFIVLVPIITAILISFTNYDPSHQNKFNWIGLSNYATIATGQGIAGKVFWLILGWTLIWTLGASTLAIVIGFVLALLVNNKRVIGKKFFRTVYLLPWAIPAFITIMFFSIMASRGGVIPTTIESLFGVSLDIKNNAMYTRLALIMLQGWLGNAYVFLLSTGVMQGIPDDLYEAASIDGATGIQQTTRITIPLVLYQIAPILINQYTFNFNNFSIIYLFNQGGPFNPSLYGNLAGSTDILISYIYKLTMENQYQAIGAAITVFISIVLMFISYLGYRNTAAFKED